MTWLHRFLLRFRWYRYLTDWTKVIMLPGFRPLPLFTVITFLIKQVMDSSMTSKASSLAYNFMLALFPGTIFLFTLIPYIPIKHFQDSLLSTLSIIMPANAYEAMESAIVEVIKKQNVSLLSFGFLSTIYFATNGVSRLMQAFNKSSLITESRTWLRRRWVALVLTMMISFSLLIAITLMIISSKIIGFMQHAIFSAAPFWAFLIAVTRWIVVVAIFFVTVSILYRYGPAHKRRRWKFVNSGSIMATFLAVLTSLGFTWYINNFAHYNKIYGSIGTLIVIMIWLYLNSLILLIGFEFNAAVELSKQTIKISRPRFNSFKGLKADAPAKQRTKQQ